MFQRRVSEGAPLSGSVQIESPAWLAGGGEMGALTRAKDWSGTPLGPAETWPESSKGGTVDAACRATAVAMRANPLDIPFAAIYLLDEKGLTALRVAGVGLPQDATTERAQEVKALATPTGRPSASCG